jgi:hypothetical protein
MEKHGVIIFGICNKKGAILHVILALFLVFSLLIVSILTVKLLDQQQHQLADQAFNRIDMEIAALHYYYKHKPKHHDAIYEYKHWITYWYEDSQLIIWFDGYYNYRLILQLNAERLPISSQYDYDE